MACFFNKGENCIAAGKIDLYYDIFLRNIFYLNEAAAVCLF